MNLPEIIWFDTSVNSLENILITRQLRTSYHVTTFTVHTQASEYIHSRNNIDCVITSGKFGEDLTNLIHNSESVSKIIVFCANVSYHSTWASRFNKVIKVTENYEEMMDYLNAN